MAVHCQQQAYSLALYSEQETTIVAVDRRRVGLHIARKVDSDRAGD